MSTTVNPPTDNIPLADDDTTDEITEEDILKLSLGSGNKTRAIAAAASHLNPMSSTESIPYGGGRTMSMSTTSSSPAQPSSLDIDINPDEAEEKERLITQVLELQNTLDDLSQRVDSVKEENLKLKSENQVLGQYIENLMSASSVFQSTTPNATSKATSPQPSSATSSAPSSATSKSAASTNSVTV